MAEQDPRLESIARELSQFPAAVLQQYESAHDKARTLLSAEDLVTWAEQGAAISRQSVRAWEAATDYYAASMDVLPFLSFANFVPWARYGSDLCQASPTIAAAYFRASAHTLPHLRPSAGRRLERAGQVPVQGHLEVDGPGLQVLRRQPS